ncbi:MAG: hypothetical protein Q9169_007323, partial [Polycauliona sp. 2 TL-2023]
MFGYVLNHKTVGCRWNAIRPDEVEYLLHTRDADAWKPQNQMVQRLSSERQTASPRKKARSEKDVFTINNMNRRSITELDQPTIVTPIITQQKQIIHLKDEGSNVRECQSNGSWDRQPVRKRKYSALCDDDEMQSALFDVIHPSEIMLRDEDLEVQKLEIMQESFLEKGIGSYTAANNEAASIAEDTYRRSPRAQFVFASHRFVAVAVAVAVVIVVETNTTGGISSADSPISADRTANLLFKCNTNTAFTTCCVGGEEICGSDLLCHNLNGKFVARQYCTDPTWETDQCSQLCPQNDEAARNNECCDDGEGYQINPNNGQIVLQTRTQSSRSSSSTAAGFTVAATATTATAGAATTGTNGASALPTPETTSSGLSTGAKAGIAIGAVAGVAIIAGLVFLLFRERKKRRA